MTRTALATADGDQRKALLALVAALLRQPFGWIGRANRRS